MSLKIKSLPHISQFENEQSGIKRVLEAYHFYLPQFDIKMVSPKSNSYDLVVSHAGMGNGTADIAHLHGLYWTADYDAPLWEYDANRRIVNDLRIASHITVPSEWVAQTIRRDMRINPHVIGHGISLEWWQANADIQKRNYVLWNKNRIGDVCSNEDVLWLAKTFKDIDFVLTFGGENQSLNVQVCGIQPHNKMMEIVNQAGVYLSTTKETFGIGVLEAMAAGVPVLGYAKGGNLDLVQHGVNGYLAQNFDDLCEGLVYCFKHRQILGENGRKLAQDWTWPKQIEKIANVYQQAAQPQESNVSVVIPVYNKSQNEIQRAVDSCLNQTLQPSSIIVVDDGSDKSDWIWLEDDRYYSVKLIEQTNQGVANARNNGIAHTVSKYVCCLDADDWLEPEFLEVCVKALENDKALGVAYTGLQWHKPDGTTDLSEWPSEWEYDKFLKKQNQVPTCAVFKREMWQRLGGYRQRYAPTGAGTEDAEFWLRSGAYGYKAEKVDRRGLFNYSFMSGHTSKEDYNEVYWLGWHPWVEDNQHPFVSYATPKKISHPVRQYDEPLVSVIIPVGVGHEKLLIDALDSLEAQTFRRWEVIIAWDSVEPVAYLQEAYPYINITFGSIKGGKGAGYARNRGVEVAKAPLILFLDADDTLHPDALIDMVNDWNEHRQIIYSDFVGHAIVDIEFAQQLENEGRLAGYSILKNDKYDVIIKDKLPEFICERALRQPEKGNLYHWCNITALLPKVWHNEIGGFDESMQTWEDIDYWWRMAFSGKCFHKINKALMRYRYHTGKRRDIGAADTEAGRQAREKMIKYLRSKYKDIKKMGCGCKGKKSVTVSEKAEIMADDNYVSAIYQGSSGNHHVIGAYEMPFDPGVASRKKGNMWVHYYGYIKRGRKTLVHKEDIRLMVNKWQIVEQVQTPQIEMPLPAVPEPVEIKIKVKSDKLDLQTIPGITSKIAKQMESQGITTKQAILDAGIEGLIALNGVAEKRAEKILDYLKEE